MTSPCSPLCAPVSGFGQLGGIVVPIRGFSAGLGKCERRLWKQQEHGGYGIPEWLAGSKRVQVKGGMLLLAAYPWKTPTGKAVREIWFEYFWKRRSKEWCWIFESGRILEEMREIL